MGVTTEVPELQCDLVMKGGITSGVIYPAALVRLAETYRFRGLGGTSAGAIGAAVGAAAEFGRESGGFDVLARLPTSLGGGALGELFHPQPATSGLLRLLFAYLRSGRAGVLRGALVGFPVASLIGIAPGIAAIVIGLLSGGLAGVLLAVVGVALVPAGWLVAVAVRLHRVVTVAVPANLFGICRGLGADGRPGFTDWLGDAIDEAAGLTSDQRPLLFGDLWTGAAVRPVAGFGAPIPAHPEIDLRMITTCLSYGRPFELPMDVRSFFYDEQVWRTLFPEHVMVALLAGSDPVPADVDEVTTETAWLDLLASRRGLRRLPPARSLPVIVATRLSLSFPGLISAVPMWDIDFAAPDTRTSLASARAALRGRTPPAVGPVTFREVWFSDGGLCSNFPVQFFDGALPTRPTFAINLGAFPEGRVPDPDQRHNIEYARNNDVIAPTYSPLATSGLGALTGFAGLAFDTARNWNDSSHLQFPGYRDRIVKVFQTDREGGLNLDMQQQVIDDLGARGRAAADAMVEQFGTDHYRPPHATGWDNHRWVRYRAFLACMPAWLGSYANGRAALGVGQDPPPSYPFTRTATRTLAEELSDALDRAAAVVAAADPETVADLTGVPNPEGVIRRVPRT
ncbi:patatin-like phospholipase family protein [Nocardioides sp. URHA0020]|uniref:patatin-like phospholipase family protein n=1 Tax=Nocardioides sp. URHA0020 TaxID=1380392 RepID=UPI000561BFF4|nr:patatin-like phospholipase family protein [Nocardioides sp. URHA0020]